MIARAASIALVGMDGHPIDVEVALAQGLPAFTIVGLPDPSIQEARERVRAALQSSAEQWPLKRVTINLSPAHLRKTGSSFDLAMALGILAAAGRIAQDRLDATAILGELSLDGAVRRVRGVLPAAIAAAAAGLRRLFVPVANAREATLVSGIDVLPVGHLSDAVRFLRGEGTLPDAPPAARAPAGLDDLGLEEIRGNAIPKRALEIAAAGGHNLLFVGPPGGGKTMLARRLARLLPPLSETEALEVTRLYSVAGLLRGDEGLVTRRPFRAPHHTGSTSGLVGGGSGGVPHPGEVSLAHRGVLFLDEFGEFRREVLEALRQPMEDGVVTIVRARWAVRFPARFQLVAASNPCPCGHFGSERKGCSCQPTNVSAYRARLRGPVADRIDLQVNVAPLRREELFGPPDGEPTDAVAARVVAARTRQAERCARAGARSNAELPPRDLERICALTPGARRRVENAVDNVGLSARGAHRVIRVARTIADLAAEEAVSADSVEEALQFRVLERQ